MVIVADQWPPGEVARDLSPDGLRDQNDAWVEQGRFARAFIIGGTGDCLGLFLGHDQNPLEPEVASATGCQPGGSAIQRLIADSYQPAPFAQIGT